MKKNYRIAVLPGDGIGPEVMSEALKFIPVIEKKFHCNIHTSIFPVGGYAIDHYGEALPKDTIKGCEESDSILFGSIGGPKWEKLPPNQQPERSALLPLRKHFNLFANLRSCLCMPELSHASPLRYELVQSGIDVLCVRELTGGIYFGEPKYLNESSEETIAVDTMVYKKSEIVRIAHIAFQQATQRRKKLVSIDKANVLQNSILWRRTVNEIALNYPDVEVTHMYIDNAVMQLIKNPSNFDVILAENLFGDIISDEMAMIIGSIGMLPSASLGLSSSTNRRFGLYEPSGGSAPDIVGQGIANPIAQILSLALMFRYSFDELDIATAIETSVKETIVLGFRTADIWTEGRIKVGTQEMGNLILESLTMKLR